jgi:outer membrane protein insertion porin family
VQPGASEYIFDEEGVTTLSSLGHTLLYDRRDSRITPSEGYYLRLGNEFAGLGGTEHFVRNSFGAGKYFKLTDEPDGMVLALTSNFGYMFGVGDHAIRINERYYLGGETMRGFKIAGISPRDFETQDALGGLWEAEGSAEIKVPLGLPKEFGIQGKLFTDIGDVGPTDASVAKSGVTVQQSTSPRVSVGTGVVWKSPMGPINVDIGYPIVRESFDKMQIFRLNFGTRF